MAAALDLLSWAFVLGGAFFTLVGALGLLRLPDVFARMHAAGMTDTMGAALILAGLCFHGDGLTALRLLLVVAFLWFTSPISTHALARAALQGGVRPLTGSAAQGGRARTAQSSPAPTAQSSPARTAQSSPVPTAQSSPARTARPGPAPPSAAPPPQAAPPPHADPKGGSP